VQPFAERHLHQLGITGIADQEGAGQRCGALIVSERAVDLG
jgi:hypothetical protein